MAVDDFSVYVIVGFFDDEFTSAEMAADPAEIFVKISKHGSDVSGLLSTLALTASVALQSGTPWPSLRDKWDGIRFGDLADTRYRSLVDAVLNGVDACVTERKKVLGI